MAVRIGASILSADFLTLGSELQKAEAAGCDCVHVDVMDGEFVDNIAVGLCVAKWLSQATTLRLDAHLAVLHPQKFIDAFADINMGAILFHPEAYPHCFQLLDMIKSRGMLAGVALLPSTDLQLIKPVLPYIDVIDQLAVNAGFPNQSYNTAVNAKLTELKRLKEQRGYSYEIQVDGGINTGTARQAALAGAETLIAGSALFESDSIERFVTCVKACTD